MLSYLSPLTFLVPFGVGVPLIAARQGLLHAGGMICEWMGGWMDDGWGAVWMSGWMDGWTFLGIHLQLPKSKPTPERDGATKRDMCYALGVQPSQCCHVQKRDYDRDRKKWTHTGTESRNRGVTWETRSDRQPPQKGQTQGRNPMHRHLCVTVMWRVLWISAQLLPKLHHSNMSTSLEMSCQATCSKQICVVHDSAGFYPVVTH